MRSKIPGKEGVKRDKETIRDLKALLNRQAKEIRFLHNEIQSIIKPVRERRQHIDRNKLSSDEWKQDFLNRLKTEVWGKK